MPPIDPNRGAVRLIAASALAAAVAVTLVAWLTRHLRPNEWTPITPPAASREEQSLELDEPSRKFVWEVERAAFKTIHSFAPRLTRALQQADSGTLLRFCTPGFQGQVFQSDAAETVERTFASFRWLRANQVGTRSVDRTQFADWLLDITRRFPDQPNVQFSLLYLKPVDRGRLEGAWTGTWILRWYGQIDSAPAELVVRGTFACEELPADMARAEEWISGWQVEQMSEARATHALMENVVACSGIALDQIWDNWNTSPSEFSSVTGGVYACDYNHDGLVDLLITDRKSAPRLYAGRGSFRFQDVSLPAGLPWDSATRRPVAFADLDNDGDADLLLGTAVLENTGTRFRNRTTLPVGPEAGAFAVADYDRDGYVDVYVSYDAPEPWRASGRTSWVDDQSGMPNRLLRNRGDFQFEDATESAGAAAGHRSTFTSLWLDADADGWPDLYVINELGANLLLRNERNGTFSEHQVGPAFDGFTMGVAAADADGDGDVDLYLGNMFSKAGLRIIANLPEDAYPPAIMQRMSRFVSGNSLLRNDGGLRFEEVSNSTTAGVGWAYAPAFLDLDGDGLLDIHSTCGYASFTRGDPDG